MLTCVCRPVSGNFPKMPPNFMPIAKPINPFHNEYENNEDYSDDDYNNNNECNDHNITTAMVVTAEPKVNVPGRLTSAELKAMALRQQQQIDTQHQLLANKEQRLRYLKSQEVRNAVANAEGERLRRLRERVEAQESKLRRLRALRGQVDLQKTYNVTLSNDLDSIRALFSEKEKELSLAVAKVEALTRQLEDLRRDRRCPINLLTGTQGATVTAGAQNMPPQASRELEKLRRELMFRNQLSLQQDARLHLQREALQQRQAELRSVDQRIFELQTRLQRKKAANVQISNNQQHQNQQQLLLQQQQQQQHLINHQQQQQQQQQQAYNDALAFQNTVLVKQGVAALKQQLLQKQANHIAAAVVAASHQQQQQQQQQQQKQQVATNFSNLINREHNRNVSRNNVAAVEPYIHAPQKSSITSTANFLSGNGPNVLKHAATANTNQQNQLIQDLTHMKLNLTTPAVSTAPNATVNGNNISPAFGGSPHYFVGGESDETKLAKKMLTASMSLGKTNDSAKVSEKTDSSQHIYAEVGPKKRDLMKESAALNVETSAANVNGMQGSKIPKSIMSTTSATALISKLNSAAAVTTSTMSITSTTNVNREQRTDDRQQDDREILSEKKSAPQLTVHSMPLGVANKSVATGVANICTTTATTTISAKPQINNNNNSNLVVPPRKPISSVAPTSVMSSIPKMKVNRVAPNMVTSSTASTVSTSAIQTQQQQQPKMSSHMTLQTERPALPPKPSKMSPSETSQVDGAANRTKPISNAVESSNNNNNIHFGLQNLNINDNLPIKAKPLTIRKQPMCEQPRLKSTNGATKPNTQQYTRKIDIPSATAFLFPDGKRQDVERSSPEQKTQQEKQQEKRPFSPTSSNQSSPKSQSSTEDCEKLADQINNSTASNSSTDSATTEAKRRTRGSLSSSNTNNNTSSSNGTKPKLARRVSFDPLALLLDASLEGELELVKKTAMQVANPSAANDEGITALHNAICAGHFDIVKFLVEFGCDVNAQDSDGWTPLHCAASCNNLAMVKFLVESGACLFAQTLSDHETPAEKCEEDEEGFDGCSEYLYSIQEKLGILHGGEVYAVFSYEAQNNDELTFSVNDRLNILRKGDDAESEWWWAKNSNDIEGYVPRNLLGLYPRVPPQITDFKD